MLFYKVSSDRLVDDYEILPEQSYIFNIENRDILFDVWYGRHAHAFNKICEYVMRQCNIPMKSLNKTNIIDVLW